MDSTCRSALVQWVNAAETGCEKIASLVDLRDGHLLARLLRTIDPVKWQKDERSVYGRFSMVSKFIEGHYSLPARLKINMTAITNDGDEQELSKVLVVLLHAAVNGGSSCRKQFMDAALRLPNELQVLICMQLEDIDSYKKGGIHSHRRLDGITSSRASLSRLPPAAVAAYSPASVERSSRYCGETRSDGVRSQNRVADEQKCDDPASERQHRQSDAAESQLPQQQQQRTPPTSAASLLPVSSPLHSYFFGSPVVFETVSDSDQTPPVAVGRRQARIARVEGGSLGEDAVHRLRLSLADELSRRDCVEDELHESERRCAELESQLSAGERKRREEVAALRSEIEELQAAGRQDEECGRLRTALEAEKHRSQELAVETARLHQDAAELHAQLLAARTSESQARSELHGCAAALLCHRHELDEERARVAQLSEALRKCEADLANCCSGIPTADDGAESSTSSLRRTPSRSALSLATDDDRPAVGEPLSVVLEQKLAEVEADLDECRAKLLEKDERLQQLESDRARALVERAEALEQLGMLREEAGSASCRLLQLEAAAADTEVMHQRAEAETRAELDALRANADHVVATLTEAAAREATAAAEQARQLMARVAELSSERNRAAATAETAQAEREVLGNRMHALEAELDRALKAAATAAAAAADNAERWELERAELEQQAAAVRSERDRLADESNSLRADVGRLLAQADEAERLLAAACVDGKAIERSLRDEATRLVERADAAEARAEAAESRIAALDAKRVAAVDAIQRELADRELIAAQAASSLQARVDELEQDLRAAQHLVAGSAAAAVAAEESTRRTLDEAASNLSALRVERDELARQVLAEAEACASKVAAAYEARQHIEDKLRLLTSSSRSSADELRAAVGRLESERDVLLERLRETERLLSEAGELAAAAATDSRQRQEIAAAAASAAAAEAAARERELQTRVAELENAGDVLSKRANDAEADRMSVLEDLRLARSDLCTAQARCDRLTVEQNVLLEEHEKLTKERDKLSDEQKKLTAVQDSLMKEQDKLAEQWKKLTAERDSLADERDKLTKERGTLTAEWKILSEELGRVKDERDKLMKERDDLIEGQDKLIAHQNKLTEECDKLRWEQNEVASERNRLATERDGLTEERDKLMKERDEQIKECDERAVEQSKLMTERDTLSEEVDKMKNEWDKHMKERDQLNEERDKLVAKQDKLTGERDKLTSEQAELASQWNKLAAERDALVGDRERLMKELDAQTEQYDKLTAERDMVTAERDTLSEELRKMMNERDSLMKERSELTEERDKQTAKQTELREERDKLMAKQNDLTAERDDMTSEQTELASERNKLVAALDALTEEHDRRLKELGERTQQCDKLTAERDKLTAEQILKTVERDKLAEECHTMTTKCNVQTAERSLLEAERDKLQEELERLTAERDVLTDERQQLEEGLKSLEVEWDKLIVEKERLTGELDRSAQQNLLLVNELNQLAADRDRIAEERDRTLNEARRLSEQQQHDQMADEQRRSKEAELSQTVENERRQLSDELRQLTEERDRLTEVKNNVAQEQNQLTANQSLLVEDRARLAQEQSRLVEESTQLTTERAMLAGELDILKKQQDLLTQEQNRLAEERCSWTREQQQAHAERGKLIAELCAAALESDDEAKAESSLALLPLAALFGDGGQQTLRAAEKVKTNLISALKCARALQDQVDRSECELASVRADNERLRTALQEATLLLPTHNDRMQAEEAPDEVESRRPLHRSQCPTQEPELVRASGATEKLETGSEQLHGSAHSGQPACGGCVTGTSSTVGAAAETLANEQVKCLQDKLEDSRKTIECYRAYYAQKKELVLELTRQVEVLKNEKSTHSELLLNSQRDYLDLKKQFSMLSSELNKIKESTVFSAHSITSDSAVAIDSQCRPRSRRKPLPQQRQPLPAGAIATLAGGAEAAAASSHGLSLCSSVCAASEASICDTTNISRIERLESSCISRLHPASFSFITPVKVAACEDEPGPRPEFTDVGRLAELRRRNELCQPHLRSSYVLEETADAAERHPQPSLPVGRGRRSRTSASPSPSSSPLLLTSLDAARSAAVAAVTERAARLAGLGRPQPQSFVLPSVASANDSVGRSPRRRSLAPAKSPRAAKVFRTDENQRPEPIGAALAAATRRCSPRSSVAAAKSKVPASSPAMTQVTSHITASAQAVLLSSRTSARSRQHSPQ